MPASLTGRFVEKHRRGYAHVQGLGCSGERDLDGSVAAATNERPEPLPLGAEDQSEPSAQISLPHRLSAVRRCRVDPQSRALDLGEKTRQVGNHRDGQMLDGAGRRTAHDGGDACRAVSREHDTRRTRALGAPAHGAQVPRVGDLIEADEKRLAVASELVGVGIPKGRATGDDALVVARSGESRQRPFRLDAETKPWILP
jgi:hypothetical protein